MSAKLFIAAKAINYIKSGFKEEYENPELVGVSDVRLSERKKEVANILKSKYNKKDYFILNLPFYSDGIRDYKYSFNRSEYTVYDTLAVSTTGGKDVRIYKDESGKKYINPISYMDGNSNYGEIKIVIDGKCYVLKKAIEELILSPGIHKIEIKCDYVHSGYLYEQRIKVNKRFHIYLREGNNYFSIIGNFKDGFTGVDSDYSDLRYITGYEYVLEKYQVKVGLAEVSFNAGIVTHQAFVSEHSDNYYIYEANVPVSDSIDERDVFLVNRSEFGQTLRVNKVFEEHSKEIKQTNRGVIKSENNSFKQECRIEQKPKKYYNKPDLAEIMSAFDYTVYEEGMVINSVIKEIQYLCIPYNVIKIGKRAFINSSYVRYLKTIEFTKDVKIVEEMAFSGCENLLDLKLNEGLEEIGICAFSGCKHLRKLIVPSTVRRIGSSAFSNTAIKEVAIPKGCFVDGNAFPKGTIVVYGTLEDLANYKQELERKKKEQEALEILSLINARLKEIDNAEAELDRIERLEEEKRLEEERKEKERLELIEKEKQDRIDRYKKLVETDPNEKAKQARYKNQFEFFF